jgi:hypothetical protein
MCCNKNPGQRRIQQFVEHTLFKKSAVEIALFRLN